MRGNTHSTISRTIIPRLPLSSLYFLSSVPASEGSLGSEEELANDPSDTTRSPIVGRRWRKDASSMPRLISWLSAASRFMLDVAFDGPVVLLAALRSDRSRRYAMTERRARVCALPEVGDKALCGVGSENGDFSTSVSVLGSSSPTAVDRVELAGIDRGVRVSAADTTAGLSMGKNDRRLAERGVGPGARRNGEGGDNVAALGGGACEVGMAREGTEG